MEFLQSIEQLALSTWIREGGAIYGYPFILFLHTIGLATVVGGSSAIALRTLGMFQMIPLRSLDKLFPLMWGGFLMTLVSGSLLLMADATVKLTNPTFYVKMCLILVGVLVMRRQQKTVFTDPNMDSAPVPGSAKTLAWVSLVCWLGAVTAGRLLAYLGPVAGLA